MRCETALLLMINKFFEAINNSQIIGMVMVDFRKAFDSVDHILLLKKLRHYKLSAEAVNWFSSYLLNRKQIVVINNTVSATENIVCGVPQGSILGPLLFLLFINDLLMFQQTSMLMILHYFRLVSPKSPLNEVYS